MLRERFPSNLQPLGGAPIADQRERPVAVGRAVWYTPGVQSPETEGESADLIHSEAFLRSLMRRQLRLSIACAAAFLSMLLGLPLANYFAPELMATRVVGGFTASWFLLGIGFFPAVWVISWVFIRRSIALERAEVEEVERRSDTTKR